MSDSSVGVAVIVGTSMPPGMRGEEPKRWSTGQRGGIIAMVWDGTLGNVRAFKRKWFL